MALTRRAPRLGLALGSGSARGWAHIGVLQVLDEEGVRGKIALHPGQAAALLHDQTHRRRA